jgi:pectinesterase inhibitor-like protein
MKLLQATVSLVFLLACATSNASVLHDACQSFAAIRYKDADYDYCVKFFQADKESATADHRGLAVIGAKLIEATAKSTGSLIATMLTSEKDKEQLNCLVACGKGYLNAMDEIGKAAKGIISRTDGGVEDVVTALGGALDASLDCEDGFQKLHKLSPLAAEDARFRKETCITLFVTGTLLPQTNNNSKLGI